MTFLSKKRVVVVDDSEVMLYDFPVQEEFGRATLLNILEAEDDEDNMVIEVGVAIAGERVVVGEDCGMFEDGGIKQDLGILTLSDV